MLLIFICLLFEFLDYIAYFNIAVNNLDITFLYLISLEAIVFSVVIRSANLEVVRSFSWFDVDEVSDTIKNMKRGKVAGVDDIRTKQIKKFSP